MNRRGFLVGAFLAPIGTFIAVKYQLVLPWRPKSFLYVVPTSKQAYALYNELGRPKNVKVIPAGAAICGYGADLIIMDENWREWQHDSYVRKERLDDWFNSTIRTRLYPGGRIITKRLV